MHIITFDCAQSIPWILPIKEFPALNFIWNPIEVNSFPVLGHCKDFERLWLVSIDLWEGVMCLKIC